MKRKLLLSKPSQIALCVVSAFCIFEITLSLFIQNPTFYLLQGNSHGAYTFARSITIDATQAGTADSTNFPLVVNGTFTYLKVVGSGGDVQSSTGLDIAYYSDSTCATLLPFERVSYASTTGVVEFWINVPTVSHTTSTVIYECYGKTGATDLSNTTGTWNANVKARYHLQAGNGAGNTVTDSTGNNNGSMVGGLNLVACQIGNCIQNTVAANTSYVDLGTMANLYNGSNTAETVSYWINLGSTLVQANTVAYGQVTTSSSQPAFDSYLANGSTTGELADCVTNTCASFAVIKPTGFIFSASTWYRVMAVLDLGTNANSKFYVNGTDVSAAFASGGTKPTVFNTSTAHEALFRKDTDRLVGKEDEVGFDNIGRSASWALLDYNNQNPSSTLLTISSPL